MEILTIILMVVSLCGILGTMNSEGPKEVTYSEFLTMVEKGTIKEVSLDWNNETFLFVCNNIPFRWSDLCHIHIF